MNGEKLASIIVNTAAAGAIAFGAGLEIAAVNAHDEARDSYATALGTQAAVEQQFEAEHPDATQMPVNVKNGPLDQWVTASEQEAEANHKEDLGTFILLGGIVVAAGYNITQSVRSKNQLRSRAESAIVHFEERRAEFINMAMAALAVRGEAQALHEEYLKLVWATGEALGLTEEENNALIQEALAKSREEHGEFFQLLIDTITEARSQTRAAATPDDRPSAKPATTTPASTPATAKPAPSTRPAPAPKPAPAAARTNTQRPVSGRPVRKRR